LSERGTGDENREIGEGTEVTGGRPARERKNKGQLKQACNNTRGFQGKREGTDKGIQKLRETEKRGNIRLDRALRGGANKLGRGGRGGGGGEENYIKQRRHWRDEQPLGERVTRQGHFFGGGGGKKKWGTNAGTK